MITFAALLSLVILIFSAILHEVTHGFVADRLGDPTARLMGRLTLNPRSHIDPFYSILVPLLLLLTGSPVIIGAAKPVPVDPFNLKEGRKDMALVALSGPLINIILAVVASFLMKGIVVFLSMNTILTSAPLYFLYSFLNVVVELNLVLGSYSPFRRFKSFCITSS